MKRLLSVLVLAFALSGAVLAQQSMSDQQVLEYVKTGMQQGKDQRQIATELARRGVTQEQAQRVKKLYEQQNASAGKDANATGQERTRVREKTQEDTYVAGDFNFDPRSDADRMARKAPLDSVSAYYEGMGPDMEGMEKMRKDQVYGRDIFGTKNLTFEPSVNLATPPNYRLGPGDEVIIDIWGTNQATIRDQVSPDGSITIPDLGLVYLNGMTIAEANQYLRKELNKIYAGLDNEQNPSSQIKVTLGNIRTIQVNVMGEVFQPGTYALSSFSTVFHALYRAGGVSDIGSLRNIQVVRGGQKIAVVDVYDFIMQGKINDDIRLQEGDVIIVPPYEALVGIEGNVKRPMKYEMKSNESVSTLLRYAGGFSGDAYTRSLRMVRQNGKEYQIYTIDDIDYSVFQVKDGDVLTAEAILDRFENKLEIRGAVYRPGIYQFGGALNTVRQLVEKADGLMGDAFTGRAVLHRERENLKKEVLQIDIKGIMDGTVPDVPLQRNDVLYIPSIHDLEDLGSITVYGEVARPGEFVFADNTTLEDVIIQAGGLKESASTVRVDVSRRIKDSKGTEAVSTIGQMYSFSLKDGFVIDGEPGFILQPYDQVFVRKSPAYKEQVNVSVTGEILYEGNYALTEKSERLSDLIKKAGGVTPFAYIKGARLSRRINDDERRRMETVLEMAKTGKDSIDVNRLDLGDIYYVGIDLEKAMLNPGSSADIVLREGDVIEIPEYNNTVRISGAVMYPNTVSFEDGKTLKYYIEQAGGYGFRAKKSKAYVVYMNGQVKRAKQGSRELIQPGCEVIVPVKEKSNWSLQNTLSIATTSASLATMIASIANILK